MKYFIFILFLLCASIYAQNNIDYVRLTNKQIITSQELKNSGIINLSDIVSIINKTSNSTIDGLQQYWAVNSNNSFSYQNFNLFIDGQKFETNIFNVNDINLLPISIDQIDSVIVIFTPQIVNGIFTELGSINIITKIPSTGFSLNASYIVANETGDPGPYKFTDYSSPNVDKLNYINTASIIGAGENWRVRGNLKLEENYLTDNTLNSRVQSILSYNNKANLTSGSIQFIINLFGRDQQVMAGYSERNEFFFFKPYGNEIPVNRVINHTGITGGFNLSSKIDLNYQFIISKNELGETPNDQNIKFDFGLNNYFGNIEGQYSNSFSKWILGINYNEYVAYGSSNITESKVLFTEIYTSLNFRLTKQFNQNFTAFMKKQSDESSIKYTMASLWNIDMKNSLELNLSYSENMFSEDLNIWSWILKGYNSSVIKLLNYTIYGTPNKPKKLNANLQYKFDGALSNFELSVGYRDFENLYNEEQIFMYNENTTELYSPIDVTFNKNGEYLVTNAGYEYKFSDRLSNKIYYNYQTELSSNTNESIVPEHNVTYSISYRPVENFGMSARIKYISESTWTAYKYAELQSSEFYSYKLSPKFLFDFSIDKWFWNRLIWTNLLFKNITNTKEQYHPIGASLDLRIVFQLHLYLNSLFE